MVQFSGAGSMEKGNQEAASRLVLLVYADLRRTAERYMRQERPDHTLQATALINETYLKLFGQPSKHFQNRTHFFAVAANTMRHLLVDYARRRKAQKRPGVHRVTLEEAFNVSAAFARDLHEELDQSEQLLKLDSALERLAKLDARQARIVELRFFLGQTVEETADVLGISARQVKREWSLARAWLHGELEPSHHGDLAGELGSR